MKLNLSIDELCAVTGGEFIGSKESHEELLIDNVVEDSRSPAIWERTMFVALKGSNTDGHAYVDEFVLKGGQVVLCGDRFENKAVNQILVDDPLTALQKIAINHRKKFDLPVIGITGSNGKTIVKEWLYHVLKDNFKIVRSPKSYNSQLGVPLSVLQITEKNTLAIFEAGISRPDEMQYLKEMIRPTHGVFTGIGDAHSANFESNEQKMSEKLKLFDSVEHLFRYEKEDHQPDIPFNDEASKVNAALVFKVSKYFGLSDDLIEKRLSVLPTVPMRMQQIAGKSECVILNDAYSADLQSLDIALQHIAHFSKFKKKVLFITPLEDNIAANRLEDLVEMADLDEIIMIGGDSNLRNVRHFETVDDYLVKPDVYDHSVLLFKGSRKIGLEKIVNVYADKKRNTALIVDLGAIRNNLNHIKDQLPVETKVLIMVKAESYGAGLIELAKFYEEEKVDSLGVAFVNEGVRLKKAGIKLPVIVMNPEPNGYDDLIDHGLEPSIYSIEGLVEFIHELILKQKKHYPIHIKLDSGMNRLGFREEELDELMDVLDTQPEVYVKSLFSHLSSADDQHERDFTYSQIRRFEIMTGFLMDKLNYKVERHIANSAGTMNYPRAHFDMVRLGIGLYGLLTDSDASFENAITLKSTISQIKKVESGESIGYGRSYFAEEDKNIGVVPIGYGDGLKRALGAGRWSVLVNGQKAKIVGRICMDMFMIDLKGIEAKRGDEVQIFGSGNSIFDMALTLRTIPYEIITSIAQRVHRIYLDG